MRVGEEYRLGCVLRSSDDMKSDSTEVNFVSTIPHKQQACRKDDKSFERVKTLIEHGY
ncbi:MAG: hypothetical protein ACPGXX_22410 [Planctomycetaceae bacterium]